MVLHAQKVVPPRERNGLVHAQYCDQWGAHRCTKWRQRSRAGWPTICIATSCLERALCESTAPGNRVSGLTMACGAPLFGRTYLAQAYSECGSPSRASYCSPCLDPKQFRHAPTHPNANHTHQPISALPPQVHSVLHHRSRRAALCPTVRSTRPDRP